jgi:hypothetical protein
MADIIIDGVHIRPSAIVMDSAGEEHLVCFYLDDAKSGTDIAEAMKPGYTLTQPEAPLKRCAACHVANYCSRDCQLEHWKSGHKGLCSDMSASRALDGYLHEPFRKLKSFAELTV